MCFEALLTICPVPAWIVRCGLLLAGVQKSGDVQECTTTPHPRSTNQTTALPQDNKPTSGGGLKISRDSLGHTRDPPGCGPSLSCYGRLSNVEAMSCVRHISLVIASERKIGPIRTHRLHNILSSTCTTTSSPPLFAIAFTQLFNNVF